jgi:hypothetical protein
MGIGEATAAEVRHRVGLAPDDVVQEPEAEVLQRRADAEDVVIAADDEQRTVGLEHPAAFRQPGSREGIVFCKGGELVPGIIDGIDDAGVRPCQHAFKLKVVGWIGENKIDAGVGERPEALHAIAYKNPIQHIGQRVFRRGKWSRRRRPGTQYLNPGLRVDGSSTR